VTGTFAANDGSIAIGAVRGDPTWLDGTVHAVYYNPRTRQIVAADNWDASPAILATVGGLTYLVVVAVLGIRTRRRRRLRIAREDQHHDRAQASVTGP
jgi:hypothetical protein